MKPLSKKIRLWSGILLGIIFLVLVPIILANSLGYHLGKIEDIFTIVKTGGIYVSSDLSGVKIYVDDEYFKDSGMFLKNVLVQNLKPNEKHKIVAMRDGYHNWAKVLPVYESLVTESRVLMLKTEIETRIIYPFFGESQNGTTTPPINLKPVKDIDPQFLIDSIIPTNPEYRFLVNLFNDTDEDVYSTSTTSLKKETELKLATTSTSTLIKRNIPEYFEKLNVSDPDELENLITISHQVAWLVDGNIILNWIDEKNTPSFYYCLDFTLCRDQIVLDWQDDIKRFDFLPGRSDVFIVLVDSGIYAVEVDDRSERNIQPIYLGENLDFRKNQNDRIIVRDGLVFHEIKL